MQNKKHKPMVCIRKTLLLLALIMVVLLEHNPKAAIFNDADIVT
jgi:hypothetical protein